VGMEIAAGSGISIIPCSEGGSHSRSRLFSGGNLASF
jgi:hypothetical protein